MKGISDEQISRCKMKIQALDIFNKATSNLNRIFVVLVIVIARQRINEKSISVVFDRWDEFVDDQPNCFRPELHD
jgi:hypothetical protein